MAPGSTANSTFLLAKVEALKARTELLTGLDKVVSTKEFENITPAQWFSLNNQLNTIANKILEQINSYADMFWLDSRKGKEQDKLVDALGEIELELSNAYTFYDTFMDILTQRLSPVLGPLLRGCDVIAADGLKHPYLTSATKHPIVYCDRGFGARILREGVTLARSVNPVSFIAIPYSRLAEKYNLISIYHEVGHQGLNKLALVDALQDVFSTCIQQAGGNQLMRNLFSNWSREIMPDFWAFAYTGMAQTSSMRDVLFVPQAMAFGVSPSQQHPPPYLRFLVSVEWCRFLWGRGEWDDWAEEWDTLYPVKKADKVTQGIIVQAKAFLPRIAHATITTRFKKLGGKAITVLFDLEAISPSNLRKYHNEEDFKNAPVGVQLASFRLKRDKQGMPIEVLNRLMNSWLTKLNRNSINHSKN